ncbi:cell division protein FtsL [Allopseudospirillum japonicum]|uniref:Cell division protein FtsL n=1 Tax=Allopseudospirillum japonicum TaxID=64971 RepID=A0A1H6QKU9_9GAMM|nr:cell division protein FtsL [Allopseudospirillum japonicum]SEI40100.1 cell division protein FtsL [Allopseudospirillum japonicum]
MAYQPSNARPMSATHRQKQLHPQHQPAANQDTSDQTISHQRSPEVSFHLLPFLWQSIKALQWRRPSWSSLVITVLVLGVLASAQAVIYVTHLSRTHYIGLQKAQQQRDAYQVEWGQLLLEQSAWASPARVEQVAAQQLGMQVPQIKEIRMLPLEQAADPAP